MGYKILKIRKKDLKYLSRIIQKRWHLNKATADFEARKYLAYNKKRAGWIAFLNKKQIGCGLFDYSHPNIPKYHPWFFLLWVEPNHRGKHIGAKISLKRIIYARRHGYQFVYLDTIKAKKYHQKLGWVKTDAPNFPGKNIMKFDLSNNFPLTQ